MTRYFLPDHKFPDLIQKSVRTPFYISNILIGLKDRQKTFDVALSEKLGMDVKVREHTKPDIPVDWDKSGLVVYLAKNPEPYQYDILYNLHGERKLQGFDQSVVPTEREGDWRYEHEANGYNVTSCSKEIEDDMPETIFDMLEKR